MVMHVHFTIHTRRNDNTEHWIHGMQLALIFVFLLFGIRLVGLFCISYYVSHLLLNMSDSYRAALV